MNEQKVYLLNKLIALYHRDPEVLRALAFLANRPESYKQEMLTIEDALKPNVARAAGPTQSAVNLSTLEGNQMYNAIMRSALLQQLFVPDLLPFSQAPPEQVEIFAQLADITPDPQTMLFSESRIFMRALNEISQAGSTDASSWFVADMVKFLSLYEEQRDIAEQLITLACSSYWAPVLRALEGEQNAARQLTKISGAVANSLETWQKLLTSELSSILFTSPHPLTMSKELIELGWKRYVHETKQTVLDEATAQLGLADGESEPPRDRRKKLATVIVELLQTQYRAEVEPIISDLNLYIEAAQHVLAVRKFAKLDAFVYGWSEIATLAMADYVSLEDVERYIVQNSSTNPALFFSPRAKQLYEKVSRSESLLNFFRLRPYFHEINEEELVQYRPAPPIIIEETEPSEASRTIELAPLEQGTNQRGLMPTTYQNLTLRIAGIAPASGDITQVVHQTASYQIQVLLPPTDQAEYILVVPIQTLLANIDTILGMPFQAEGEVYIEDTAQKHTGFQLRDRLLQAGKELNRSLQFENSLGVFEAALQSGRRTRVILETQDSDMLSLPWELLPIPGRNGSIATDRSFSFVRTPPQILVGPIRRLDVPLRVLFLTLDWNGAPAPSTTSITNVLDQALIARSGFLVRDISAERTTRANVSHQLIEFDPHIVHIEFGEPSALGGLPPKDDFLPPGNMVLPFAGDSETHDRDWVSAALFSELLHETSVSLLIFGSNPLVNLSMNSLVQLTLELLRSGLPAAVVPTRGVDSASKKIFINELYLSLLQGHHLEIAMVNARSAVAFADRNWSAFALFANSGALDAFNNAAP